MVRAPFPVRSAASLSRMLIVTALEGNNAVTAILCADGNTTPRPSFQDRRTELSKQIERDICDVLSGAGDVEGIPREAKRGRKETEGAGACLKRML
jgi:hypothetical protein